MAYLSLRMKCGPTFLIPDVWFCLILLTNLIKRLSMALVILSLEGVTYGNAGYLDSWSSACSTGVHLGLAGFGGNSLLASQKIN